MAYTRSYYLGFVYGVPFGFSAVVLLLMTLINKRVNWLLLRSILGVDLDDEKKKKGKREHSANPASNSSQQQQGRNNSSQQQQGKANASQQQQPDTLKSYLFIDFKGETKEDSARLTVIQRFFSDLLVSAILGIFVTIIFNSLILSSESVKNSDPCPDYDASCFGNDGTQDVGPFSCEKGNTTSFTINSNTWWCVGWVYQARSAKDVLDTLGTCGGLLGLVSSIVPIVYYLSYHKNCCCPFSLTWIVPLLAPAALAFLVWYSRPLGPSVLAIITLVVVIGMVFVGWVWAAERSCRCSEKCSQQRGGESCCDKTPLLSWVVSILSRPSKSYPWCCSCCSSCSSEISIFYKCCHSNFPCCNKCLDCCCANEADKFKEGIPKKEDRSPSPSPPSSAHTVIQFQPQSSAKQPRLTKNEYPKTAW